MNTKTFESMRSLRKATGLVLCALGLLLPCLAEAQANAANGKLLYENNNTCLNCHNSQQPADKAEQVFKNVSAAYASRGWTLTGAAVIYGDGSAANQGNPSLLADIQTRNWKGMWAAGAYTPSQLADMAAYLDAAYWGKSITAPEPACAAQTLTWTVGGLGGGTCSATVATTAAGKTYLATDSTVPATGNATFACSATGVWSTVPSGATCVTPPTDCSAAALSWTVGAYTCNATAPMTTSGSSAVLQDLTAPTTGAATYSCSNGSWSPSSMATCATATVAPPASCSATAMSWTVGGNTCAATAAATTSGSTLVVQDTAAPATGAASYTCSNGAWTGPASASCVVQQAACAATALNWTVSGTSCNAAAPASASGVSVLLQDTTDPTTGSANYTCTNGSWSAAPSTTCINTTPAALDCVATALNWTVGSNACSATASPTLSGSALTVTDTVSPTTGTAAYTCTNGVWAIAGGSTCYAEPASPRSVSSLNGEKLWTALIGSKSGACADCHNVAKLANMDPADKIMTAVGTSADQGVPAAIRRGIQSVKTMAEFTAVSDADLADIAAFVNAKAYEKALTAGTGIVPEKQYVLWKNGASVTTLVMPTTAFASSSVVRLAFAIQAPANASLHIDHLAVSNPMFTLNRVPVSTLDQQAMAIAANKPCPVGAFDLLAGEACGLELVLAVSKPGVETAKLDIYADSAQKLDSVTVEASVTAQATGGAGGGGCTMRSSSQLMDPVLLLMTVAAGVVLAMRRRKNAQTITSEEK